MSTTTVHDPVCHMDIDPATAAGTSEYKGQTYYFCSPGCRKSFDKDQRSISAKLTNTRINTNRFDSPIWTV